jgi:exo-beta-1,3-glucanase (GH17 family)
MLKLRLPLLAACLCAAAASAAPVYRLHGLNFSPYMNGQDPGLHTQIPEQQIVDRLAVIKDYTLHVRSFGLTDGLERIPAVAKSLGLKTAVNAWLGPETTDAQRQANLLQLDRLVAAANRGEVDIAIVGSEVLERGDLPAARLIEHMNYVRVRIPSTIPVTTADTHNKLLENPAVIAAGSIVMPNYYPYWFGIPLSAAIATVDGWHAQIVAAANGREVIVSESGWPSAGNTRGSAVPSAENAAAYFNAFVGWARTRGVKYFYFEAFDEAWKAAHEGPQGAHWGLWTSAGALKPGMQPVFDGFIVAPQGDCAQPVEGSGTPSVTHSFVPVFGDIVRNLSGRVLHVRPADIATVTYIYIGELGTWWVKPTAASPTVTPACNGSFSVDFTTGGIDERATKIRTYIIPRSYTPPVSGFGSELPASLESNALARTETARTQRGISGKVAVGSTPLAGLTVLLSGAASATAVTSAGGEYSFPNLPACGDYTVRPQAQGYTFTPASRTLPCSAGSQTADFIAEPAFTFGTEPLRFVPITPCRAVDTRIGSGGLGGPPLSAGQTRTFPLPSSACGIPPTARAYALNATIVPFEALGFLTVWPAGQAQPFVSTLNSPDARIKANAAIVPAGTGGAVSVFATHRTQVILDVSGYFVPAAESTAALAFYPMSPCRVVDTREPAMGALGAPVMSASSRRTFPLLASLCAIPAAARAYSLNITAVPMAGTLGFLTAWPTGAARPDVSALNAVTGTIVANAAIVPAGSGGGIDIYTQHESHVVVDVNGYFAPAGTGGLSLYAMQPCRTFDTRLPANAPSLLGSRDVNVQAGPCGALTDARAYVMSVTAIPRGMLGYLALWPQGQLQPLVSTLNAIDGVIASNMAIVPTNNGVISVFAQHESDVFLDMSAVFAP